MSAKVTLSSDKAHRVSTDVLVLILDGEVPEGAHFEALDEAFGGQLQAHLEHVDFKPSTGATLVVPTLGSLSARQLVVSGVRKDSTQSLDASLTEAVSSGVRQGLALGPGKIAVALPAGASPRAAGLGARLGDYRFDRHRTEKKLPPLKTLTLLSQRSISAADRAEVARGVQLGEGVCLARDLVNEPPNILYPETFAKTARAVARRHKMTCKVLDHAALKKAGHHLHDAVGKGSERSPCLIHLTYKPKKPKGCIAFVGKGLTFDSGGLCIKPAGGMPDMKSDMAGGAAVLGLMESLAAIAPDIEVHGIIGAAENMPDAAAYRPSDVIPSLSGKTVEVINTDAEGRLVLADSLTYATRLKPDFIVDAATLTGATLVSLGAPYSAFFTGSDAIASAMDGAAQTAGESFWRMPLVEELRADLRSDIADLKHTGERWGGAITAALFLREFTGGVPWMHCDIPGPVLRNRAVGMHPKGGTGHAVLTFAGLVERHAASKIVGGDAEKTSARGGSKRSRSAARSVPRASAAGTPRRRRPAGAKTAPTQKKASPIKKSAVKKSSAAKKKASKKKA